MLDLIRRIGVRHLIGKPLRTVLILLAVALGIGLSVAIGIINRAVLDSFRESVGALAGRSALTVTAGNVGFPEETADDIAKVAGVKSAIPRVEAWGFVAGDKKGTETLYILGIDMLREQAVRSYKSGNDSVMDDPLLFLNEPDSVILTRTFAAAHGLKMGSSLPLATSTGQITLIVRGLLDAEGPAKAYGGAVAIMDIDGARVMLGKEGKTDAVDIVPRKGVETDALRVALKTALGPSFVVEAPEGYAHQLEQLVQPFQATLAFFGSMALLVGLFLVANSMGMSIAERQKEIGVLRAIGATRPQIFVLLLSECAVLGAVGSVAGAYLGRALSGVMVKDIAEAMTSQFAIKISIDGLRFDSGVVLRAVALGVVTATVAGFVPAFRATRIPAIVAMQSHSNSEGAKEGRSVSFLVGLACLAYVLLTIAIPRLATERAIAGIAQVAGLVGVVLISPKLVLLLVEGIRKVVAPRNDVIARLAADNILRYRRRTNANVVGLTLGLIFVMLLAGISHSMKKTILTWFDVNMRYDIIISSSGNVIHDAVQALHEDVAKELGEVPGIWNRTRKVEAIRDLHIEYEGHTIMLKAYDEPDPSLHYWIFDAQDTTRDELGRGLYHSDDMTAAVSTNFVLHFGKKTGDFLTLNTPSGPTRCRIVGVLTDFASPEGVVYLARERYKTLWKDPLVTAFGVYVEPGADGNAVRAELDRRFGQSKNLIFMLNSDFRSEFSKMIDTSFAAADGLQSAALFVALIGIFNTLTVGILARTRELGMLRAIGIERGQLARMILLEAVVQGAATAILSVGLGALLSYWLILKSLPSTIGWVINYSLPWSSAALIFATGVAVSALAGAYPAWRAARVNVVDALG